MRAPVALLLLAVALAGCASPSRETGPLVGQLAPAVEVQPVDGPPWTLAGQRGKVVLMDLMGVNCAPCRREMPHLVALADSLGPNATTTFVSIDLGARFPGLTAKGDEEIRAFRDHYNATWPFAADPDGRVAGAFEVLALPTKVIVGPDGVIRGKIGTEIMDVATLERELAKAGAA